MAYPGKLGLCVILFLCLLELTFAQDQLENVENETVCQGTNIGLSERGEHPFRYAFYKAQYTNCTYLVGNLEILFLDSTDFTYDLSFLSTIRQVTGYILIVGNHVDYIPLTSLQIIHGKTLFLYSKTYYSLFVALNYDPQNPSVGLKELRFSSLSEILNGKVFFMNNNQLCFENTINWQDLNPSLTPPVEFRFNSTDLRRKCEGDGVECDESCYSNITAQRHCWGVGKNRCQKLTQGEACHPSCERRCFGKLPNQCCHAECAGGCSGPKKTECLACRHFQDDGACVAYCPPETYYDNTLMVNVANPNAKYSFGGICVKACPGYLLQDSGSCVRACPEGRYAKDGKRCERCDGPCPRTCKGLEGSDFVNAANVNNFTDCTTIDGDLKILKNSFLVDPHYNISGILPSDLSVFKHVREITGYLLIQSDDANLTDLSFLSSLEVIHGRQLDHGQSLHILGTHLKSLELTSLKQIRNGNVYIVANKQLCYADTIDFGHIFSTSEQKRLSMIKWNRNPEECEKDGEVCDPQCNTTGCWGKGPNKCLQCRSYIFAEEHLCLENCSVKPLLYHEGNGSCMKCHSECANSCNGPNNYHCDQCLHVTGVNSAGQKSCLEKCPNDMYEDDNAVCQYCHVNCRKEGCTGPSDIVGEGGCLSCTVGIRKDKEDSRVTCLPDDTNFCERGYHLLAVPKTDSSPMAGKQQCEPCHSYCLTCDGPGTPYCTECRYFKGLHDQCDNFCPQYSYGDKEMKKCVMCHSECRGGCHGPTSLDCNACSNFKVYINETLFNCTAVCPPSLPHQVFDKADKQENHNVCADDSHPDVIEKNQNAAGAEKRKIIILTVSVIGGVLLLTGLLTLFGYYCQRRAKAKEKTAELTARMTGYDETEPITPTNAQPDLAKLRLIKESELRKGGIIGSGAFGTVYKGFWIPENENVKIPVAIKVLQDGTSPNQNKELLEEARVMASVENACCIRILAVCMSAQMMLITQLMPLGCLLDYVRKNKEHIGSKVLLNWCTQIAKGMSYLEERGIVHRDLAARNVLVQTPTQVKITDFGLAKLLDYNEEEYHAAGGKMPIKWLALECIQHRIFTHKSDVWSFGVTAWELFTYGQKPYDNIRARDVPGLLEKGERLPQPSICTIDVYMIMIKCWMLDADSRPSFKELAEEFAKMARDPGRYLVVQGDVLKKIPEDNYHGSDLELSPIDGVDSTLSSVGEGDTLLRLPSHSYDKNDLLRSVSMAGDGPEEIIEADDYLQPQQHEVPLSPRQVLFDNNNSPSAPFFPQGAANYPMKLEIKGEAGGLPWREKNYAHLDAAVEARKQRQLSPTRMREDSFNSRYSSDPIKFFKDKDEIDGFGAYMPSLHANIAMPSTPKPKVLQLAVDEDNYLAPQSTNNVTYTDLNDKGYYQNEKVFEEEPSDDAADHMLTPSYGVPSVTNPEYFEHDDDDVWETKPLQNGLHHPTSMKGKLPLLENGHGYYNDFNGSPACLLFTDGDHDGSSMVPLMSAMQSRDQRPSESQV